MKFAMNSTGSTKAQNVARWKLAPRNTVKMITHEYPNIPAKPVPDDLMHNR